jgi:signal transduction histidine kinase
MIGKRFAQVIPSVPELEENTRRALSGEEFSTTITINSFVFEFCYLPIFDRGGEVTGLIGVALDVTSKVEAQKELDEYRRQMEKTTYLAEVGSMGSAMAQKLGEPLAVTRLMLQRVLADLGGTRFDDDDTDVKSLSKALSEVSRAADIVNRFQSTAHVTSGINAEPVDLYQITKRMIAVFAQSARQANLTMSVKDMDAVLNLAIPTRQLEQVFFILVQSAIDRADTGEKQNLTISCHISARQVELRFSDTCGGIEPEKLKDIFEPFFTTAPGTKDTGLGLAVAKRVICDHDGHITVKSRPGRGITFYVTLPIEGA